MTVIEEIRNKKDTKCIESNTKMAEVKIFLIGNHILCTWIKCNPEKQGLAKWIWKPDQNICCLQETHFGLKDRNWK